MAPRNPPWTREETMLALDVYFRIGQWRFSERDSEIDTLSGLLRVLSVHPDPPDPERYRNRSSVIKKLWNLAVHDDSYHGVGLQAGSRMDKLVWDEFVSDRERLHAWAQNVRESLSLPTSQALIREPEAEGYPEGRISYALHRVRERNRAAVRDKKRRALEREGVLRCEVCGFSFAEKYGDLGEGVIDCHHVVPVRDLDPGAQTGLEDLALVCCNCHRMLHLGKQVLSVDELRQLVAGTG